MRGERSAAVRTLKPTLSEQDAIRFCWWFSTDDARRKGAFVPQYMRGLREGWSLDQWRAAIDKAMQAEDKAEDAKLNRKLRESVEQEVKDRREIRAGELKSACLSS